MSAVRASRRGLLASVAALAVPVTGGAAALASTAQHSDAEVLRLGAEFVDLERQLNEMPDTEYGTPEDAAADAATTAMVDRQAEIADVLLGMPPATTAEGHVAVARCLTAWTCSDDYPLDGDVTARLTATLLRNMTGRVPRPGWVPPPPVPTALSQDDALLGLCSAYIVAWEEKQQAWEAAMAAGEQAVRDHEMNRPSWHEWNGPAWKLAAEISRMPARTPAGIKAKAQVVRCWLRDCGAQYQQLHMTHPGTAMAWSLVCDMLGRETVA